MSEQSLNYQLPDSEALSSKAQAQLVIAREFAVTDPETYQMAGVELNAIRAKYKKLEEQRLSITRPMDEAKKRVMDLFKPPMMLLEQADAALATNMVSYHEKCEREAAEARAKAQAEAAAERERLAKEARDAEEAAAKLAKEAQERSGETARQAELEAAAKASEARALAQQASMVTAAPPVVVAPVSTGAGTAKTWKVEVLDLLALVKFVAAHPEHIGLVKADEVKLKALARSMEENFNVDGVRASQVTGIRSAR